MYSSENVVICKVNKFCLADLSYYEHFQQVEIFLVRAFLALKKP